MQLNYILTDFYLLNLSVTNKDIDISNYIIDLCLLSEVLPGFVYRFGHPFFRCINVKDVLSSWKTDLFIIMKCFSLSLIIYLALKSALS